MKRKIHARDVSYGKLIQQLRTYCNKKKPEAILYDGLEYSAEFESDLGREIGAGAKFPIDPKLPIDLVAVTTIPEKDAKGNDVESHYYTLYFVIVSTDDITEKRLLFYTFYLSRVVKSKALELVLVIPQDVQDKHVQRLNKIAKENGFGLLRFLRKKRKPEELYSPRDFVECMAYQFNNPPKRKRKFRKKIREQALDISFFFDEYIQKVVESFAGIDSSKFGKRYIDRMLLNKVFDLQTISYAKGLKKLVAEHLMDKYSDYDFVSNTFKALWLDCNLGDYEDFLRISEPHLYHLSSTGEKPYRDHYIHQFQVFLTGLCIIDILRQNNNLQLCNEIDKQWLIAASFHDMAFPLQNYDDWAKKFFLDSLGIPEIGVSDIRSYFVDKSLMSSLGFLVTELCKKHFSVKDFSDNWLHQERDLIKFLHGRITELKHHCLLSSLFLLKKAAEDKEELLPTLFAPAALSIALHHHEKVWTKQGKEDEAFDHLPPNRRLGVIDFIKDPLTFILIYCDNSHEWGRPRHLDEAKYAKELHSFVLKQFSVTNSQCLVSIKAPNSSQTDDIWVLKCGELRALQKLLIPPPGLRFNIELKDKSETPMNFEMHGPA